MKVFRNRTSLTYILKLLAFTILIPSISFAAAFVRVNQVGYPANSSKRAYLMASGVETGATFAVKNSGGTTLFSGPIGANLGSWSNSYPDVYALDVFDRDRGRNLHDHSQWAHRGLLPTD